MSRPRKYDGSTSTERVRVYRQGARARSASLREVLVSLQSHLELLERSTAELRGVVQSMVHPASPAYALASGVANLAQSSSSLLFVACHHYGDALALAVFPSAGEVFTAGSLDRDSPASTSPADYPGGGVQGGNDPGEPVVP